MGKNIAVFFPIQKTLSHLLVCRQVQLTLFFNLSHNKIMQKHRNIQFFWIRKLLSVTLNRIPLPMRLLIIMLCISVGCINATNTYAQNTILELNVENQTVENVLNEIENQTEFMFFYNSKQVDVHRRVSVTANKRNVFKILDEIFRNTNVTYSVLDKSIILSSKKLVQPEELRKITGKIVDVRGEPVIGATVAVKGTSKGTVSDLDGKFVLQIEAGKEILLEISYIGYQPQEVKVGSRADLTVTLKENLQLLDEVVVVGYGSIKAKELTSSISHVSSDLFLNVSASNPLMQIQGKVASVSITNTAMADPNSDASVQIRGVSSRNAGLGPLYVIDGIPGANIQNVNSNDIASIDILKDGAASAIYGTRGSNGVIIITTKRGNTDGKISVTYNGYFAIDKIVNKPELLNAREFREYRVPNGSPDYGASTDWFDEVTKTGATQNHSVTISGGSNKFNYRATVDFKDATGVDLRSERKEYGGRVILNQGTSSDLFKFSITAAPRVINRDFADQGAIDIALRANPTFPVMDSDDPTLYNDFTGKLPTGPNPVETLKLIQSGSETKMLDWSASATFNILAAIDPDLLQKGGLFNTQISISQSIIDNFDYYFNPSTTSVNRFNNIKGTASRGYSKAKSEALEWIGTGAYQLGEHSFNGMVGYSYNYYESSGMSARNRNFVSDALGYNNLGSGDNEAKLDPDRVGMSSVKESSKLIGFFGRISYNYKSKYMLTGSLRYEGSSRFGDNNKWGYFPAVSGGWRISEESFMRSYKWIDDLKLRADLGITGNQEIPNYKSLALYSPFGQTYYNGQYISVVGPNTNINPNLRWEKAINWNIGIDFSLFKNKVTGSLNYYNRKQKDLVGDYIAPIPPNIVPTIYANVGTMKNSGLEVEIQIAAVKTKDFSYNIGLVGEVNSNTFESFSNDTYKGKGYDDAAYLNLGDFGLSGVPIQRVEEGKRVGTFYMHSYAGIDANGKWLVWNADKTQKIPIADAKEADKHYVGNGLPKYKWSMTHTFNYKKFDLSLSFRGAFDFDIYNTFDYAFSLKDAQKGYNVLRDAYRQNLYVEDGLAKPTDYFLRKGDFMKLDVATLGYTLDLKENRFLSRVRAYVTGRNLFTIKPYDGIDPDFIPVNGLTPGALTGTNYYPSSLQILFGLQLNF